MSRGAYIELSLFFAGLLLAVYALIGCSAAPESARRRWAISAEFERCARSLSDAQCAIIYRERCILHGLEKGCFSESRW